MNPTLLNYASNLSELPAVCSLLKDKWAVLLDSGYHKKASDNARYDIFSAQPCLTIESLGINKEFENDLNITKYSASLDELGIDKLSIDKNDKNPLNQMRSILAKVKKISYEQIDFDSIEDDLPFCGGWLGYFSYDFGKSLELAETKKETEFDIPHCIFGLYRWALISDHKNKTTRIYNFGLEKNDWNKVLAFFQTELNDTELHQKNIAPKNNPEFNSSFYLKGKFHSNLNFETYEKNFNQIQENILAGNCYQINYAHRFVASASGNSFDAYRHLSKTNKSPFSAYLNFEDFQILSLSPERFIKVNNKKVITQPIKGTAPRDKNPKIDQQLAQDLTQSEKDKAENLMIVDLLRNDLSKTADRASVKVPELFGLHSFESVHHLISTITSQLAPQYDCYDVLQSSLPGGSITGAPKIAAMKIIDQLEDFKRGIYCGVIGYLDFNGNMDTNICIRTLLAKDDHLFCWAGGGIVFDSKVESEFQETFHKVSKIIPVLEEEFLNYE